MLLSDLIHAETAAAYVQLIGVRPGDCSSSDTERLRQTAKAQIAALYRIQRYTRFSQGHTTALLGNHDTPVLISHMPGNTHGVRHTESLSAHGGMELPQVLNRWFAGLSTELTVDNMNFSHVGPTPWLQSYNDMFYTSKKAKQWWLYNPDHVKRMGYRSGAYGHTMMRDGIRIF